MWVCESFFASRIHGIIYAAIVEMYGFFHFSPCQPYRRSKVISAAHGETVFRWFCFPFFFYMYLWYLIWCVCAGSDYASVHLNDKKKNKKENRTNAHIIWNKVTEFPNFRISSFVFVIVFALDLYRCTLNTLERFACELASICVFLCTHQKKTKKTFSFCLLFRGNEDYVCKRVVN